MDHQHRIGTFEWLLAGLSLYVITVLAAERFLPLSVESQRVLQWTDTAICIVFLADFCIRFARADNKLRFMKWGWIDLLSSIPMLDTFRLGRLVRVARILRLLRGVRSARMLCRVLFQTRAKGAMATTSFAAITIAAVSAITILHVENTPDSNITTAGDAVWWAISTMSTVGYGDRYPVTLEGRVIAVVLMFTGVALFGTFTASLASWFLGERAEQSAAEKDTEIATGRAAGN